MFPLHGMTTLGQTRGLWSRLTGQYSVHRCSLTFVGRSKCGPPTRALMFHACHGVHLHPRKSALKALLHPTVTVPWRLSGVMPFLKPLQLGSAL